MPWPTCSAWLRASRPRRRTFCSGFGLDAMPRGILAFLQRTVVWCSVAALVPTPARADPALRAAQPAHVEGIAAGQAVQSAVRSSVQAPSATAVVPGYTSTPPERSHYGQTNLSGASNAQLGACAMTPTDPVCQALLGAQASANTPREAVSPHDTVVVGARRIAGNPALALDDIASFYRGCQVDTVAAPATETRLCRQYTGATAQSCADRK